MKFSKCFQKISLILRCIFSDARSTNILLDPITEKSCLHAGFEYPEIYFYVVPEGFQQRREGGNGLKDRAFLGLLVDRRAAA